MDFVQFDFFPKELMKGAIINDEFPGFKEDYLVLHAILKGSSPLSVFEIGTNHGKGTSIIKNAVPWASVYSLDLPYEESDAKERTGSICDFPFTQFFGDSMTFDYSKYPCEAYFVDGAHTFKHVFHETVEILKLKPKIIVYHDSNISEVMQGIQEGFLGNKDYRLTRVADTRILYATRN